MENPPPDLTPEQLAALRLKEKPTPSEKEVFEGKIMELKEENARLKAENEELKKPKIQPQPKILGGKWCPL